MINSRRTVFYSFILLGWVLGRITSIKFADYGIFVFFLAFSIPYLGWKKILGIAFLNLITVYLSEFPFLIQTREFFIDAGFPYLFEGAFLYASGFSIFAIWGAYRHLKKKRAFERIGMIH